MIQWLINLFGGWLGYGPLMPFKCPHNYKLVSWGKDTDNGITCYVELFKCKECGQLYSTSTLKESERNSGIAGIIEESHIDEHGVRVIDRFNLQSVSFVLQKVPDQSSPHEDSKKPT